MGTVKVGKRGAMVIPADEREKARIVQGDRVEVTAIKEGELLVRKMPSLKEIQKRMAGKLPQWSQLEGKADELLEEELKA